VGTGDGRFVLAAAAEALPAGLDGLVTERDAGAGMGPISERALVALAGTRRPAWLLEARREGPQRS
jgi:hypothetical protein